jgi:hypothetical protein
MITNSNNFPVQMSPKCPLAQLKLAIRIRYASRECLPHIYLTPSIYFHLTWSFLV